MNTDNVVDYLNRAFKADPVAIHSLVVNRVPANQALIDHEHVIVGAAMSDPNRAELGMLGLINGLLSANNQPIIEFVWEEVEGKMIPVGFRKRGS